MLITPTERAALDHLAAAVARCADAVLDFVRAVARALCCAARLLVRILTRHLRGRIMAAPFVRSPAKVTVAHDGLAFTMTASEFSIEPGPVGPGRFTPTVTVRATGTYEMSGVPPAVPAPPAKPPALTPEEFKVLLRDGELFTYVGPAGQAPAVPRVARASPADADVLRKELATMQGGTADRRRVAWAAPRVVQSGAGLTQVEGMYLADGPPPRVGQFVVLNLDLAQGRRCRFVALVVSVTLATGSVYYHSHGLVQLEQATPQGRRKVYRWQAAFGAWWQIPMSAVRKGDVLRVEGYPGHWRAESDGYTGPDGMGAVDRCLPCPDPAAPAAPADPWEPLRKALAAADGPRISRGGTDGVFYGFDKVEPPVLLGPSDGPRFLSAEFDTKAAFCQGELLRVTVPCGPCRVEFEAQVTDVDESRRGPDFSCVEYESRGPVTIVTVGGARTVLR